jgi:hypothetical protein
VRPLKTSCIKRTLEKCNMIKKNQMYFWLFMD